MIIGRKKISKVYKSDLWFYLFLIAVILYYTFDFTELSEILNFSFMKYIAVFCWGISIFYQKNTIKGWVKILIIMLISFVNFFQLDGKANILLLFCIATGITESKKNNSLFIYMVSKIIAFFLVFGSALLGITAMKTQYLHKSLISFGFATHNGAVLCLFIIMGLYFILYSSEKKKSSIDILFWALLIAFITLFTKSRTGGFVCILFLILIVGYRKYRIEHILSSIAAVIFPVLFVLSYIFPLYLNTTLISGMNVLLNNRFSLSRSVIEHSKLTLFGGNIKFYENASYNFLDSGYLQLLYLGGIVISVLVIVAYISLIIFASKKKEYMIIICCICYSIYMFTESIFCSFSSNFLPLFMYLVFDKSAHNEFYKLKKKVSLKNDMRLRVKI